MIKSLEIKNIQSHKDSRLELSPGINALIGSSNNGKSAILRALNWAVNNRPLGTEILLSNWAYDAKGKQKDEMSVTVEKENRDWMLVFKKQTIGHDPLVVMEWITFEKIFLAGRKEKDD